MARVGYNPKRVNLKTDAGIRIPMGILAHFQLSAEEAVTASADGIAKGLKLGAAEQTITTGLANPPCARGLQLVANVSGVTTDVKITGTNIAGEVIDETLTLTAMSPVSSTKAFRSVTSVELPIQTHTPTKQIETIDVTHIADGTGTLVFRVASTPLATPVDVNVPVDSGDDSVAKVATKIRAALNAETDITDLYEVGGEDQYIVLTVLEPLANDSSLAMSLEDADGTNVSVGSSVDTEGGIPYDMVSIGWTDIIGLPHLLSHNTLIGGKCFLDNAIDGSATTVTVDPEHIELNTIDPHTGLSGAVVDVYYIVPND